MDLSKVYEHTVGVCRDMEKENLLKEPSHTVFQDHPNVELSGYDTPCEVTVVNLDSFTTARFLLERGADKVLVLNMASDYQPGGGVFKGARAQEEELFRCSDYHRHLLPLKRHAYPLKNIDCILTPGVTVIKKPFSENYKNLRPFVVDCLAISAIRNPRLMRGKYNEEDEKLTRKKIVQIFTVAASCNYKHLVLGAFGCGAYKNPPEQVARIFKEELKTWSNYFDKVVFAVLCTKDMTNFNAFTSVFQQEKLQEAASFKDEEFPPLK